MPLYRPRAEIPLSSACHEPAHLIFATDFLMATMDPMDESGETGADLKKDHADQPEMKNQLPALEIKWHS